MAEDQYQPFKAELAKEEGELLQRFAQSSPKEYLIIKKVVEQNIEHYKNIMNLRNDMNIGLAAAAAQHSVVVLSNIFKDLYLLDAVPQPRSKPGMSQYR